MATSKPVALETSDVSITTCTVTIKRLQVNKRQLTQSIFRQLPHIKLFDDETSDIELNGNPWGYVGYHWGQMDANSTHFILQCGSVLHRSLFRIRSFSSLRPPSEEDGSYLSDLGSEAWDLLVAKRKAMEPDLVYDYRNPRNTKYMMIPGAHQSFDIEYPFKVGEYMGNAKKYLEMVATGQMTIADIQARLDSLGERMIDYGRRWDALMEQLRNVHQLFIAA